MNYFIFTAIVAMAASKSKVQSKNNQNNKDRKKNFDDKIAAARKSD